MEAVGEYWAALQAHQSYFTSEDFVAFIVNEVVGRKAEGGPPHGPPVDAA